MNQRPTIDTLRLILRPFTLADAPEVQRLAGDKNIAANTGNIPHPYEDGMAEKWIGTLQEKYDSGQLVNFAIMRLADDCLIGAIGLDVNQAHDSAELGYWVGKPYWNLGYATEAAKALVQYGFVELGLNRVFARHFKRNPASGRVLRKAGMTYEGCLRQDVKKWERFEDMECYGLLRSEFVPNQ